MLICCIDALVWKEAFEKAKKIVGSECEIYAGKNNPDQIHAESDSESSEISYESTDNEESTKSGLNEIGALPLTEDKCTEVSEEKLIEELQQLQVKNEENK